MRRNHRAALRDIAMRNSHPVDMIRAAAAAGIDSRLVIKRLRWSPYFFDRCCKRNKIVFVAECSSGLSEPADVILEHVLIGLCVEEQFTIAQRVAERLGFRLARKSVPRTDYNSREAVSRRSASSGQQSSAVEAP